MPEKGEGISFNIYEERLNRLACDLHDGVTQQLVAILWKIDDLKRDESQLNIIAELEKLEEKIRGIIADLQQIIAGVRPVLIDQLGLQEAIRVWVSAQLSDRNVDFVFTGYPYPLKLPHFISEQLFRIIQEGVNNILQHSQAKQVVLRIECEEKKLRITLTDDGKGFQPEFVKKGLGLTIIKERTLVIGGDVQIKSDLGGGTTLEINLPYEGVEKL